MISSLVTLDIQFGLVHSFCEPNLTELEIQGFFKKILLGPKVMCKDNGLWREKSFDSNLQFFFL